MLDYPSNITREQFELIREDLESARNKTKPRKLDLYEVFCGILYILKGGCQWRMLPKDFPKWRSVHQYFLIWSNKEEGKESILEQVLKKIGNLSAYHKWQKRNDEFLYSRRTECEEY
jgi:transposase